MLLALLLVAAQALPSPARLEGSMLEAVTSLCGTRKVTVARDLSRACRAYVAAAGAGRASVSGPAVAFFASLESAEPAPVAAVATVHPPSQADRAVGELFPRSCRFNRIGVAAAVLPSGGAVVCALTALHATDLASIPGRVRPGQTVSVAGTLAAGLSRPRLFVTRPSGGVDEIHLRSKGGRFSARVGLKARGEHSIEVLAEGPGGPQVVAMRRVFAGVMPPTRPPPDPPSGEGLEGVEAAIAHLRASRGLTALKRDPELDAAAEAHSKEMARLRTFAHVLSTDGGPADRLRARGYAYSSVAENIGLSSDVGRAHEAIAGSPAHLANLLDPRHRRLGLGAARGPTAEGGEGVYLTELFAVPVVGSKDPAGDVARVIAEKRRALGLAPLERDAALDSLADHEVRATALSDRMTLDRELTARALAQAPQLSSAAAELRVGSAPDEVDRLKKPRRAALDEARRGCLVRQLQTVRPGPALDRAALRAVSRFPSSSGALALGGESLDGVFRGNVRDGVVGAADAGETVPASLHGLVEALVIGGAEEVAMRLDRHFFVALEVDGRRHFSRKRLREQRHSIGPPCEARAYNRTRQGSPPRAGGSAQFAQGGPVAQGKRIET